MTMPENPQAPVLKWSPSHLISYCASKDLLVFLAGSKIRPVHVGTGQLILNPSLENAHDDIIRSGSFNEDGTLFITSSDDKYLRLWQVEDWSLLGSRLCKKKITGALFIGDDIVWSDRFGSVGQISLNDFVQPEVSHKQLLGHFSWVTQIAYNGRFLVTSDRDEKIRISCYPKSYVINSFCLGHSDIVSCLSVPSYEKLPENSLISGGGDGQIFLWNTETGDAYGNVELEDSALIRDISYNGDENLIYALSEKNQGIYVIQIEQDYSLQIKKRIELESNPLALKYIPDTGNLWVTLENGDILTVNGDTTEHASFEKEVNQFFEEVTDDEKSRAIMYCSISSWKKYQSHKKSKVAN
eukprot:TRINITY_DN6221_c0_g1_i1.p1 TRINITY_DN6221_c0_g1~~TRINITY_DN6221_c0_g1_i1.p1  ORF type:complete len:355 (+),score=79.97 TRINITY_DN6221_c0_g1_i1:40-1104(+)